MGEKKKFQLDAEAGYFRSGGVDVMAFDDFYPAGHQSGISVLMHGERAATNGDLRFEQTPGQWQPTPKQGERTLDAENNRIVTKLSYPDEDAHLRGFNPIIYPDFAFSYTVTAEGIPGGVAVTVDLEKPVPEEFLGKLCFDLELFPGALFGKPWMMDDQSGIFPRQPNGPTKQQKRNLDHTYPNKNEGRSSKLSVLADDTKGYNPIIADDLIAEPYARGHVFTLRPDDDEHRMTVVCRDAELKLYDGRMNHNNGWFVLSSEVPAGKTEGAVRWEIFPNTVKNWKREPVVQVSQVGYHPAQPKTAFAELDREDNSDGTFTLEKLTPDGFTPVLTGGGKEWGRFLRYRYLTFDFSAIRADGMYRVTYEDSVSAVFRIAEDVYDRGVWQPVLEYFLPVQMCHMRVMEKYRVWHGLCHNDDARMAPVNYNHIDGYAQGPSTLCKYQPGEHVPGLNVGGWHDAGDYDLRVESQSGEAYILTLAYEAFGVDYDTTAIDWESKTTEIHQPDGQNDILQQIKHGVLTVLAGWRALGRLYRGMICPALRQYVLLGDASTMTDGVPGNADDRWVFTEDNPPRELSTAAHLAAASRALKGFDDALSAECLTVAKTLFAETDASHAGAQKVHAAIELLLATGEEEYRSFLLADIEKTVSCAGRLGWVLCRALDAVHDEAFTAAVRAAMTAVSENCLAQSRETPYGIPYRPHIWGAGWDIQRFGFETYFLHRAFPELFPADLVYNALNFVLGCHPGSNTASFASGVGARSATTAYGANRGDWSYIPGGVISGTALIRPDFPELLEFPFLWQQAEYVLGGGSSNYMFLVLAAKQLAEEK